jgi:hypothetical protein
VHRECLREFGGLKVSSCERVCGKPGFHVVGRGKAAGIDSKAGYVSWNGNSGMSAINLAYHFGATTIVLLGFDMHQSEQGDSNYHNEHVEMKLQKKPNDQRIYDRYLTKTKTIAKDAKALGIKIINATPGSSIKDFPIMTLEEFLD